MRRVRLNPRSARTPGGSLRHGTLYPRVVGFLNKGMQTVFRVSLRPSIGAPQKIHGHRLCSAGARPSRAASGCADRGARTAMCPRIRRADRWPRALIGSSVGRTRSPRPPGCRSVTRQPSSPLCSCAYGPSPCWRRRWTCTPSSTWGLCRRRPGSAPSTWPTTLPRSPAVARLRAMLSGGRLRAQGAFD